jgi:hypothetical protein
MLTRSKHWLADRIPVRSKHWFAAATPWMLVVAVLVGINGFHWT